MADIPNRDELERILARKLGGLQKRQMGKLLELMGDPPDLNNVPMSFWDDIGMELGQVVLPFSERVYLEGAQRLMSESPVGVDWSLVNQAASDWSRNSGSQLIRDISATSRRATQEAGATDDEQAWTMGDLRKKLGSIYSPVRAEMIAVTEVTRAAAEGERGIVSELSKQGITMVEVWQTNNDELVCPICGPRHDKPKGDGWSRSDGPPAHPRCRCWVNHELPKPKEGAVEVDQEVAQPVSQGVIDQLRKQVASSTHSLDDVISGRVPVGVEGRRGADIIAAQEAGIYTTRVGSTPIYALTESNAKPLIDYLSSGGRYGSVTFSELLGYTKKEIEIYIRFLQATGQVELLI